MSVDYEIKLKDVIFGKEYTVRQIKLKIGTSHIIEDNLKVPRFTLPTMEIPLSEAYIELDDFKIRQIDADNQARDKFIMALNSKLRKNKVNLTMTTIIVKTTPDKKLLERIAGFFVDIIYSNIYTKLVAPPKLVIPEDPHLSRELFFDLLDIIKEYQDMVRPSIRPLYFIPSYVVRDYIPELVKFYIDNYGPEGLFVVDVDGKRFSSVGISIVSQLIRTLRQMYGDVEDYGIYLFNHKARKRSGKEAPSEDVLAILNGINFTGPSHKVTPLPKDVVEKMKQEGILQSKIFNKDDLLYYPASIAPNLEDFNRFIDPVKASRNPYFATELYNSTRTNEVLLSFKESDIVDDTLKNLPRDDFIQELQRVSKRVVRLLKSKPINTFFS